MFQRPKKQELSKSNKLIWLEQDIQRLLKLTFDPPKSFQKLERSMSRAQEAELLQRFEEVLEQHSIFRSKILSKSSLVATTDNSNSNNSDINIGSSIVGGNNTLGS